MDHSQRQGEFELDSLPSTRRRFFTPVADLSFASSFSAFATL